MTPTQSRVAAFLLAADLPPHPTARARLADVQAHLRAGLVPPWMALAWANVVTGLPVSARSAIATRAREYLSGKRPIPTRVCTSPLIRALWAWEAKQDPVAAEIARRTFRSERQGQRQGRPVFACNGRYWRWESTGTRGQWTEIDRAAFEADIQAILKEQA